VVVLVRTAKESLQGVLLTPPLVSPQPAASKDRCSENGEIR
jgi:hypothetical protein